MKDTLILKDGTTIGLEMGAELNNVCIISEDKTSMVNVWDRFTTDNLSEVVIKNGDGMTIGRYTDLILVSETSKIQTDDTILTSFCLREKTNMERQLEAISLQIDQNTANIDYVAMETEVEL